MSIEEKLSEIVDGNTKITDKLWFKNNLQFVKRVYSYYDVDYDFSNILDILRTIDIKTVDSDISVYYDYENNCIIRGKSSNNLHFNLAKTFMKISSQNYDLNNKKINRGLIIYDENGKINQDSVDFNDYVLSSIVTDITNLEKDEMDLAKEIRLCNKLKESTDKIGYRYLVSYLAYAKGIEFYSVLNSSNQIIKK